MMSATITASSFNNDGPCSDMRCSPEQVAYDGPVRQSYWQSAPDPKCGNAWLDADWSAVGAFDIDSFSISYGHLGRTFSANLVGLAVTTAKTATGPTETRKIPPSYLTCNSSSSSSISEPPAYFSAGRLDGCMFETGWFGDASLFRNVVGMRFEWTLAAPPLQGAVCQMNVNRIVVRPVSGRDGGLSGGAIAGICVGVVAGAVVLVYGVLFHVRRRNLAKRRRAGRLL
ncbi:hypothetical protein HDU81_009984 [Chytriomyces hyalinus]|nr:hypothetical protein HDU81_009984 [Chytriomyces hyalinus]